MQVAASPFTTPIHSQYHPYYQLHVPGPQDLELKRQYLALLQPAQIIEICLAFDTYVPPYAKTTIWPHDFNAAIAALRNSALDAPKENTPPTSEVPREVPAVMNSLRSPEPQEISSLPTTSVGTVDTNKEPERNPTPTDAPASIPVQPEPEKSAASDDHPPSHAPEQPGPNSTSSVEIVSPSPISPTTPSTTQPSPQPALQPSHIAPPQPSFPQPPYGYSHPPAAYPHTPYYAAGYAYPYAYPAMQNGYHPQAAPAVSPAAAYSPPHPASYAAMPPPPPHVAPHPEGMDMDDLPSYEDMIVEAMNECTDPDGWAPKDLFTWMASRYPVQANFRPSASQALQKAYKRGRFEKSIGGKYRLSASWEGGSTSRRSTRRPQTSVGGSAPNVTAASPFTNAPLIHPHGRALATQSPFTKEPIGFPPPGRHNQPQPHASTSTAPGTLAGAQAAIEGSASNAPGHSAESAAAYETAQNILKAINFGGLYKLPNEEGKEDASQLASHTLSQQPQPSAQANDGVEHLLSHVQAVLAASGASSTVAPIAVGSQPHQPPISTPSDSRAELQAQLALLSAQLAEFAQLEEAEGPTLELQPAVTVPAPALPTAQAPEPAATVVGSLMQALTAPTPSPSDGAVALVPPSATVPPSQPPAPEPAAAPSIPATEDSDDDDDMEEII